jgi:hypothetical protein
MTVDDRYSATFDHVEPLVGATMEIVGTALCVTNRQYHYRALRFHVEDGKGTDLRTMQDYLGYRDPRHTVHYTRVAGRRFEGLWK